MNEFFNSIVEQMDDTDMATLLNKMSNWLLTNLGDELNDDECRFLYKIMTKTSIILCPSQEGE